MAYKATTSDIIMGFCFGESTDFLMRDDYNSPFFDAMAKYFGLCWWMTHVAWMGPLLNSVPTDIQSKLNPGLESLYRMQRVCLRSPTLMFPRNILQRWVDQVEEIRSSKSLHDKRDTIFHGILNSDLPDKEKTSNRMVQEAQLLVQAGQDTTGD